MQKKYAGTGKFTVVLSYVQRKTDNVAAFLNQNAPDIPCYNQAIVPAAPCGRGIPDAALFDHTGKLLNHGHPSEIEQLVEAAVNAAPSPPSGPLAGLDVKFCKLEANALQNEKTPILQVLQSLDRHAMGSDTNKAAEARMLAGSVRKWVGGEKDRLKDMAAKEPVGTAMRLEAFVARVAGVKEGAQAVEILRKLQAEKYVWELVLISKNIQKIKEASAVKPKPGSPKPPVQDTKFFKSRLEKIAVATDATPAVTAEARSMLESLR